VSSTRVKPSDKLKIFAVDTNVLLYDPHALRAFDDNEVVIPMTVIEEIDRFKKDVNETGRNARAISRFLDGLRERGSLQTGVPTDRGGTLRVDFSSNDPKLPISWGPETNDNRILRSLLRLRDESPDKQVVFVTRDTNMRLKCDALGLIAEDYQNAHIDVDEQYTGVAERTVPESMIEALYAGQTVGLDDLQPVHAQQFLVLSAAENPGHTALARVDTKKGRLKVVPRHKEGVWGIFARNKEQLFALDLLLDDSISLVTLNGVAGTGKTLIALACGLKKTADEQTFRKLLVSRPIFPMGRDIGFLPGDLEAKLNPWMKPIFDNLEFIFSSNQEASGAGGRRNSTNGAAHEPEYRHLIDRKIIEVEALTYIRGRSIPNQYLIVDEAQNLTPHEVKTVLTRAGEGTKVILTGDPNQIDNPYVDAMSNGLTYTVERFKDSPIAGHVTLRKGERSQLAELAAELL